MEYDEYRQKYFAHPAPAPRFRFAGTFGVTLYFQEYNSAVDYYSRVLGPPAYAEGTGTRGWSISGGWLTLLQARTGAPANVEVTLVMESPGEAEALQRAFIEAGGTGPSPSNQLMYEPVRSCSVRDPFGTELLIIAPVGNR